MPQTLGAFLAMMVVMLFTINFQRASIQTQRKMLSSEVDVMANAVASEAMQYVAAKSFDALIASGTMNPSNANVSMLTELSAFGGGIAYADALDIDDFDGVSHTVTYETGWGSDLTFVLDFDVHYVDEASGLESPTPTWTKEVTIEVSGQDIMISPIRLKRQFSPLWY